MNNRKSAIIVVVAIGLATIVSITTHHILATSTDPEMWHRYSNGAWGEPIDSGMSYLYSPDTMAGVVERVEPTPDDLQSDIRQTEVYFYSDSNGNLCHTYISWDSDIESGDHITLSVVYKYQVDMNLKDGLEPTTLVDRQVTGFKITKEEK